MSIRLIRAATFSALLTLAASAVATRAFASETNPYSPANGHAYRHGVLPTRDVHNKMKQWEAQHALAAQAVAVGANTLSFGGGTNGVGVMSGKVKVYVVY
jgi:hypothetical protein